MSENQAGAGLRPDHDEKATRVDKAHVDVERVSDAPTRKDLAAIAGLDKLGCDAQLQRQAAELSDHLHAQQNALDWREAELNARLAHLETDLRAARLKSQQTRSHLGGLGSIEDRQTGQTGQHGQATPEKSAATPSADFEDVQRAVLQDLPPEQVRIDASSRAMSDELDRRQRLLQQRKKELEQRRAIVDQMHSEALSLHREAIEMRLVTQQLWSELSDAVPPASLAQSVSRLRNRLSQHYRQAIQTLAARKSELAALRDSLSQKQQRIRQQAKQLQCWADQRHREIEKHAALLAAREADLARQEQKLRLRRESMPQPCDNVR